jgi:hypothetical protein
MNRRSVALIMLASLALKAGAGFDPVKDVSISVSGGVLSVTVPQDVHLKVRMFKVVLASGGVLRLGNLPPPAGQDEAGDPIWRGTVCVALHGSSLEDPARLVITYQPCTEGPNGMCFLPMKRFLAVSAAEIPTELN